MKEASYYKQLEQSKVRCELCPQFCLLKAGESGKCRKRKNFSGKLFSLNYRETVALSLDPIEKKPLYHFYPGENILSIGPNSCNLSCNFCQNYSISQFDAPAKHITSAEILDICLEQNIKLLAFTYTEPVTWFEFVLETSILLKKSGIQTVLVTNGYINPQPLQELLPQIDAMNIDLKSMDNDFYVRNCEATLKPVLNTIRTAAGSCHLEITNLLITSENDSDKKINDLANFIADVDPDIPLHFSRYFPHYKMTNNPTPESTLYTAKAIADKKLKYVYLGNILTENSTKCPNCRKVVIERDFQTGTYIENNRCRFCDEPIYGKFA